MEQLERLMRERPEVRQAVEELLSARETRELSLAFSRAAEATALHLKGRPQS